MNLCALANICTGTQQVTFVVICSVVFIVGLWLCED